MLLEKGVVKTQADIAQKEGISRISVTRILSMLRLAPQIQSYLLNITDQKQAELFTEKKLRPITQMEDYEAQLDKFEELKRSVLIRK